ncbi:MAG: pectin acetylesterase-family hydrolase [Chloroflexota bacterium]
MFTYPLPGVFSISRRCWAVLALLLVSMAMLVGRPSAGSVVTLQSVMTQAYGRLPLSFELNQGQSDASVKFLSRGAGYTLLLTSSEAILALAEAASPDGVALSPSFSSVLRLSLAGANPAAQMVALDQLPGTVNYFVGEEARRLTGIPTYGRVAYKEVYPGVDLVFYGRQGQVEYDLVLAAGVSPGVIALNVDGAERLQLAANGDLVIHLNGKQVQMARPLVYQATADGRQELNGRYVLKGPNQVGFAVAAYDASRPLIIDPVLVYSTYFGGADNDAANGLVVDEQGNVYVTGFTMSTDLPTANPYQAAFGGGKGDAFVTKISADGSAVLYSTYLGGSDRDIGLNVAVDADGNAYVTGQTLSTDFAVENALQESFGGGEYDAFVAKIGSDGSSLAYSTYLGGSDYEGCAAIAVAGDGSAYLVGCTYSAAPQDIPFPVTADALQADHAGGNSDVFVVKIDPAGSALTYSTYLGGTDEDYGSDIALDAAGNVYLGGETFSLDFPTASPLQATHNGGLNDAFVAKLDADGSELEYSTFLGGSDQDYVSAIALDASGAVYVVGETYSADFPTAYPFQAALNQGVAESVDIPDAFVAKVSADGSGLHYATYLGGSGYDSGNDVTVDGSGRATVVGFTDSADFPTANAFQPAYAGGDYDAFVTQFDASGSAANYTSYLGGTLLDWGATVASDAAGNVYVAGYSDSADFPTANPLQAANAGTQDAFVARIEHDLGGGQGRPHFNRPLVVPMAAAGDTTAPAGTDNRRETAATGAQAAATSSMTLTWLSNAVANGQVCNDGTRSGYYLRRGSGSGVNRWIIYLQGGGACYDNATCAQRKASTPGLMTSKRWKTTLLGEGILSPSSSNNPDFYNANHIYVPYCSSDGWSGDRAASSATNGMAFRGRRIVQGVIAQLKNSTLTPSPNLNDATSVLFTGTSAGGAGVLVNLDWVTTQVPQAVVKGIDDAGWLLDIAPYDTGLPSARDRFALGYSFWTATVDSDCAAAYAATPYLCYFGVYAYPYISTPMAVQMAQRDKNTLEEWYGVVEPYDSGELAFIETFAPQIRTSLDPVTIAFSPTGNNHGILIKVAFYNTVVSGSTLRDVIGNWEFARSGPVKVIGQ